ncbi:MAG TPA: adenylate kinase [Candidatus Woesebacteria bacterium]|nr:adenylate kinase [Candidatus Woesebacteria bacterium]
MNLIILGPQGSGKGTQAKLIAEKYGLIHISAGDLLRAETKSGSKKGKIIAKILESGALVPFDTIFEVLEPKLKSSKGFILDGTPRDLRQSEYLDWFLSQNKINIDKVILLEIPREISFERLSKRAKIEHRTDDTPEAITERLSIYERETLPVVERYRQEGKLLVIDGTPDIDTIFKEICNKLDSGVKYAV